MWVVTEYNQVCDVQSKNDEQNSQYASNYCNSSIHAILSVVFIFIR